jgi:predicted membrane-bound spermidine synthase
MPSRTARPSPSTPSGMSGNAVEDRSAWPWTPHVVVLLSSAAIMIFELLAGRLIGRHLGSSIYTWTSVIGVMMAGMSLGNYWGGRWADRHPSERLMSLLLMGAAGACVLSVLLNYLFAAQFPLPIASWPLRILFTVLIVFGLPAVMLGTITPVAAKMAVQQTAQVGGAIGTIYALSALGSIGGTFLTGYYLLMVVGVTSLVLATGGGLLLLGAALFVLRVRRPDAPRTAAAGAMVAKPTECAQKMPFLQRYEPQIIVFFSAASLMAVEIVAGRLMARHLGNSIYTWTSIIGVVLAGMTLGYFLGGRMADRWSPERFLGMFCTLASVSCLVALLLNRKFETGLLPKDLSWPLRVFITAGSCFLVPSLFLGAISPGAARLALGRSTQVGRAIGGHGGDAGCVGRYARLFENWIEGRAFPGVGGILALRLAHEHVL